MVTYRADPDIVFRAVADPTRRAVLEYLLDKPHNVNELVDHFDVSRPAISKHLRILREARVVSERRDGRNRIYELNPDGLKALREYFDQFWSQALESFKRAAEEKRKTQNEKRKTRNAKRETRNEDDMTMTTEATTVSKSVTVKAGLEHAFKVFTEAFDTWWPRSHHIGKKPLQKAVIEPRAGGRCFGREADGNECQWGTVLAWEPPTRLVIAWHIAPSFQTTNLDLAASSEVEIRFTPEAGGMTRVDLDHRHLERHGADVEKLRTAVGGPGGWSGLLHMFGRTANVYLPAIKPVAFIFGNNDSLAERSFIGVKPEDLWKRPTPQTNSMLWIYAHMVATRARMLGIFGEAYELGWGDAFGRGAELQDPGTYPSREKINEAAREVSARLFAKLAGVTEADLSREAKGPRPPSAVTVGDQLAFLALHESYHVGQLAYVRKALGLPGVVG